MLKDASSLSDVSNSTKKNSFWRCPDENHYNFNSIIQIMKNLINRRSFLRSAAVIPAGLALKNIPSFGEGLPQKAEGKSPEMPMVTLGGRRFPG